MLRQKTNRNRTHCVLRYCCSNKSVLLIYNSLVSKIRSSHQRCSLEKVIFKNLAKFTKNTCARTCKSKRLQRRCFCCDFFEIFKSTFFTEHLPANASKIWLISKGLLRFRGEWPNRQRRHARISTFLAQNSSLPSVSYSTRHCFEPPSDKLPNVWIFQYLDNDLYVIIFSIKKLAYKHSIKYHNFV